MDDDAPHAAPSANKSAKRGHESYPSSGPGPDTDGLHCSGFHLRSMDLHLGLGVGEAHII